jgi:hypothetical protein
VRYSDDLDHRGLRFAEANAMFEDAACICTR